LIQIPFRNIITGDTEGVRGYLTGCGEMATQESEGLTDRLDRKAPEKNIVLKLRNSI